MSRLLFNSLSLEQAWTQGVESPGKAPKNATRSSERSGGRLRAVLGTPAVLLCVLTPPVTVLRRGLGQRG